MEKRQLRFVGVAALVVLLGMVAGCSQAGIYVDGTFEIDEPIDLELLQKSTTAAVIASDWDVRRDEIHIREGRPPMLYQEWWRLRGAWFWKEYDALLVVAGAESNVITVHVNLRNHRLKHLVPRHRQAALEQMLDEYYALRDEVFPDILGRPATELDIRTLRHPAMGVPVEQLARFDREPLNDLLERRLAQWEAGALPGTPERQREKRWELLKELGLWYGLPVLIGTLVLLLIWRFIVPHWDFGVSGRRALFVTLGFLIYAPVAVPFMGITTYAGSLIYPGPVVFFELILVSIITGVIVVLQLPALVVLWLVSRWLIKPTEELKR
ncbi:MAG: hypothetical protein JJU27_09405 [Gammaproteobacteria bacterium]|nr:hypothetical protein [Gammaproteobacteria bacterium]